MAAADTPSPSAPPPTTGLLLAAGADRRYGTPKALVDTGGGPWVLNAVRVLLEGGCPEVLVVTGAAAEEVEALVAGAEEPRVVTTRCGTWRQGTGESLRSGLTTLATRGRVVPARALVHLVGLLDVGPEVVRRVLGSMTEAESALARACYRARPGHPVLLGRDHWQAVLRQAGGDAGRRAYLRRARPSLVECGDLASGADADVPAGPAAAAGQGELRQGAGPGRPPGRDGR